MQKKNKKQSPGLATTSRTKTLALALQAYSASTYDGESFSWFFYQPGSRNKNGDFLQVEW